MKIMQVNYKMDIGGIESFLMNVYRNIDREKHEFIFLTYYPHIFDYEKEILKLNGKIIKISTPNSLNIIKHIKEIYNTIKQEKIDIVHCHTYFDSAYVMIAAKLAKVKIRIVHSHTTYGLNKTGILKKIKWFLSRFIINSLSTHQLACSTEAGKALYGKKKFSIIENGIKIEKFNYNEKHRNSYRKEWKIKNEDFVIGHIGRFDVPKNHKFLIEIYEEIYKINKNSKLILVGSGKLEDEIKKIVNEKKLTKNVIFLGNRNDINEILNAFDIFVFPSLYEGLPVTLVETQANGLKCLISDRISKEIKLTECIKFLSIDKSAREWAETIVNMNIKRINNNKALENSVYNIDNTIKKINKIYNGENNE